MTRRICGSNVGNHARIKSQYIRGGVEEKTLFAPVVSCHFSQLIDHQPSLRFLLTQSNIVIVTPSCVLRQVAHTM